MDTIPLVVNVQDDDSAKRVKGWFSSDQDTGVADVPIKSLKENLTTVCQGVATVLTDIRKVGGFELKTVTLQVEVSASGGVSLIGTANVAGKGAITLTFQE